MIDPGSEEYRQLWMACSRWIEKLRVTCPEATTEDRVYEHAPEFVQAVAEIVGYHREEDI